MNAIEIKLKIHNDYCEAVDRRRAAKSPREAQRWAQKATGLLRELQNPWGIPASK